ncbi:hypothetical protein AB0G67_45610 [Streptomyces sp. NPDC021056]|uniref:sodium:solute symporter family transporter n=1 Tax=Streptomyces sp. NPDC021056 TaxID=3155012 RepID=UPI0033E85701
MNHSSTFLAAAVDDPYALVLSSFMLFMVLALFGSVFAGLRGDSPSEFYIGDRQGSALKHGLALAGCYVSTSLLLSVTGVVATVGFDGITAATSVLLSMGVLLLLARPLQLSGSLTLGDLFSLRAPGTAPRVAAAVATLAVTAPYLVAQLMAAGNVTAALLGFSGIRVQQMCTVLIGGLVVTCGMLSGAKGLTVIQVIAAAITLAAMIFASLAVLRLFHGDVGSLLTAADAHSTRPGRYLSTGGLLNAGPTPRLDIAAGQVMTVLGGVCMPHVLSRVSAAKDTATARRSVRYATGVVALVCVTVVILGMGASARIGADTILSGQSNADDSLMLVASSLDDRLGSGTSRLLFTALACAIFLSVLAVVGATTLAAAAALARDTYHHLVQRRQSDPTRELMVARIAVLLFGVLGILLAVLAQGRSAAFLAQLATAVAASTVAPVLLYTFYWDRFNRTGLLWAVYGGIILSVGLAVLSPSASGSSQAFLPNADFAWFHHSTPVLVSVPAAFLLGWAGSLMGHRRAHRHQAQDASVTSSVLLVGRTAAAAAATGRTAEQRPERSD